MRSKTQAIIYKITKYSDESAIANVFTEDFGGIKVFVQKAYSKRGGLLSFVPGEMDIHKKDNSDLHRYYGFRTEPDKLYFLDSHDILLRMHVVFDIFHNLYGLEEPDKHLWKLINRFNVDNFRKLSSYIICYMIKANGFWSEIDTCSTCGCDFEEGGFVHQEPVCTNCLSLNKGSVIIADNFSIFFMKNFSNSNIIKNMIVNREQELKLLRFLINYIESAAEIRLKSSKPVLDMI